MSSLTLGGDGPHDDRTVPLRAVTERRALGLRTLVPPPAAEPPVRWALVSELTDPVPYLRGRELLLTAGVNLPEDSEATARYVTGLIGAGVSALGFGVTPVHDVVPPALVEQCRSQGLPLLEVPRETPFVAVSQAVGEALEELHVQELRRLGDAHRALAKAVTAAAPVERVLRTLAQALDCWAALTTERSMTHARSVPVLTDEVAELIAKLRTPGGPRSAKARMAGEEVFLHAVGEGAESSEVLLIGRAAPFGMTDRAVLGTAVALLGLLLRSPAEHGGTPEALLTRLLLGDGPVPDLDGLVAEVVGAPEGELRVAHARWRGRGARPSGPALADLFGTPLVDASTDVVRAIVPAGRTPADAEAVLDRLRRAGWLAALSGPARASGLASADRQASALLVRVRAMDQPLMWSQLDDPFEVAIDAARARDAARALLGPLAEDTETARGLRETLRVWLARHGNWDRAAADLGSHRNSVRYRIGRIERDLYVDLADPEHRMRLWFALNWLDVD
ncbi:PucR family transcriptional regulator [Marinactinospora endophytica]